MYPKTEAVSHSRSHIPVSGVWCCVFGLSWLVYLIFICPMQVAFELEHTALVVVDVIITFFFLAVRFGPEIRARSARDQPPFAHSSRLVVFCCCQNIYFNFRTSLNDESTVITDLRTIACTYLKFWFWVDLISTFPWSLVVLNADASLQLLRLFRLAALLPLLNTDANDARNVFSSLLWRLGKLGLMVLGLSWWLGCGWVAISRTEGFGTRAILVRYTTSERAREQRR